MKSTHIGVLVTALLLTGSFALAQDTSGLNARDAFWSAADSVGKRPSKTVTSPVKTASTVRKQSSTVLNASKNKQPAPVSQTPVEVASNQPAVNQVPLRTVSNAPLGLRYTLLKRTANGKYEEILPDASFHRGDRVKVSVMANEPGYLYIVQQGSSGAWSPLYPQSGMTNKLEPGKIYEVPSHGVFTFDEHAGQEKLFILFTRQPQSDLDETIISLRHDQQTNHDTGTALASNSINDAIVQQLRSNVLSRDLVFTKVDDENPKAAATDDADGPEKAMYVVNKATTSADSKIVVDVTLKHQ